MTLSFAIQETMRGDHHFVDPALGPAVDRPFHFRIDWGAPIATSINPLSGEFMHYRASGELFADGLTPEAVPCRGTLVIDYFGAHAITYDLSFEVEGVVHRYVGDKTDVRLGKPLQLIKTHTTCYGRIENAAGLIISRSVVHFRPELLLRFLRTFRLRWR